MWLALKGNNETRNCSYSYCIYNVIVEIYMQGTSYSICLSGIAIEYVHHVDGDFRQLFWQNFYQQVNLLSQPLLHALTKNNLFHRIFQLCKGI